MKFFALSFLLSATALAEDFANGQAARLVIGQPTFTAVKPGPASASVLGAASGLAFANNMLFVADASRVGAGPNNNRVLIYKDLSVLIPSPTDALPQGGRCPACVGAASLVVGQPDFVKTDIGLKPNGLRLPTAVASDGTMLAIADTDNNRVLIWRSIPTSNGQNADVVLGQKDFTTLKPLTVDASTLRGPQGVWIQNGKLFVADTMNHRVLIWNTVPTRNETPADIVLGQANFTTAPEPDLTKQLLNAQANTLLNPVSVTSDGVRLFVADLGHNRVLIWNSIPTQNQAPANIVLGQPDFTTPFANYSSKLCDPSGFDKDGKTPVYPGRCAKTMNFPRYVLSDGQRLFVADGGNDRVMIYNSIPTANAAPCDAVLGQLNADLNNTSDSAAPDYVSAVDVLRTPMSLAWDKTNLYVTDTFNRRLLVFTPAETKVPYTGVRNAASFQVFAVGAVTLGGTPKENDEVTIKIIEKEYKYKAVKDDTLIKMAAALVAKINEGSGDANVIATINPSLVQVQLTSRIGGIDGNAIAYSASMSTDAGTTTTTAGATLNGGQDAAKIAGGTIVSIVGERLSDVTVAAPEDANPLPTTLGNVQVYMDGYLAPLYFVSPTQINAQLPWEMKDSKSVSAIVRTIRANGPVEVSSAVAVPIIAENPGIFALQGVDPRPGIILHGSSFATGTISVDGSIKENDVATITLADREYKYTVKKDDSLESVRDNLIAVINAGSGDPDVRASAAGVFTRILLRGRRPGPDLNGLPIAGKVNDGASVILSATNSGLCCANVEGAPVTLENPAIPGETIIVVATGLGQIKPQEAQAFVKTGEKYNGPVQNEPVESVSSLAGAKTANVLFARLRQGSVGLYDVYLELNSDMPTNVETQLTIAQRYQVSNIVRFALKNPLDDKP